MTLVEPAEDRADERSLDRRRVAGDDLPPGSGIDVWRLAWRVSQHRPREFWVGWALFVVFFTMPAITGLLPARSGSGHWPTATRPRRTGARPRSRSSELIRMVAIHHGALIWTAAWIHMQTLLRANLLAAQMASGGPEAGRPISSAGAAITHFRDDTEDVANFVDGMVDVSGGVVFTVFAGIALGMADARAAAVLLLPLVGVAIATRTLDNRIKVYRAADRAATAEVTGLVGDVMAAATTVKVNDAVDAAARRGSSCSSTAGARRRSATGCSTSRSRRSARAPPTSGSGWCCSVSASAIASGAFGLGDLALFTAYLGWLSFLPRMIGRVLARRKQAGRGVRSDATTRRRRARAEHGQGPRAPGRAAGSARAPRRSNAPSVVRWSGSTWSDSPRSTTAAAGFATSRSRSIAASSWS